MIITYLRNVHMFDYYMATECDSFEDFERRCPAFYRPSPDKPLELKDKDTETFEDRRLATDGVKWYERLDKKLLLRTLVPGDNSPQILTFGGKLLDTEIERHLSKEKVEYVEPQKYRCKAAACNKLFKGPEFVKKHIKTKHPELIAQLQEPIVLFNNYVRDPNRVMNQQVRENQIGLGGMNMGMNMGMNIGGPSNIMNPMMMMNPLMMSQMMMNPMLMNQMMTMGGGGGSSRISGGSGYHRGGGRGGRGGGRGGYRQSCVQSPFPCFFFNLLIDMEAAVVPVVVESQTLAKSEVTSTLTPRKQTIC